MPSPRLRRFELHPLKGHERRRDGARDSVGRGSRRSKTCVLKAREGISNIVTDPRDMPSPNKEIVLHGYEDKEPN